jgi:hypothetical protein
MYTLNGVGTTCYGKANPIGDSFVATVWLVFLYFPIWPIRCHRMRLIGNDWRFLGQTTRYQIFERVNFADNLAQIALTWLWTLVPLALLALPASLSPSPGAGLFLLTGYFVAATGFLGFATTRPGRRALTEGWHSIAGLSLLTLVLYIWLTVGGVGPWRVQLAWGIAYAPGTHIVGGVLLFTALVWCGGVKSATALGGAIGLGILTSAIDIAFSWVRDQIAANPFLPLILSFVRGEMWGASLLLVASSIVPVLRRGSYWLIQLGIPSLGWLATLHIVPIATPILHNQGSLTRWIILASPFILTKTAAFGWLGSWLRRARVKA